MFEKKEMKYVIEYLMQEGVLEGNAGSCCGYINHEIMKFDCQE